MKIEGNVRGEVFKFTFYYAKDKEGEEAPRLIEEKMNKLGYPFKFSDLEPLRWYRESLSVLAILVAKELFSWTDKDIFNMGYEASKYSLLIKILMRYFVSSERVFKEAPAYWKKHFDFGDLEPVEFSEKKKYTIMRVKGYKFHPLICLYHAGYFLRIANLTVRSKKIDVKETKCVFKGEDCNEYLITW